MVIKFGSLEIETDGKKIVACDLYGAIRNRSGEIAHVQVAGEDRPSHLGVKLGESSEGYRFGFLSYEMNGDTLVVRQKTGLVEASTYFTKYDDTNALKIYSEYKNISDEPIVLEDASAFYMSGLCDNDVQTLQKVKLHTFYQSHHAECQVLASSLYDRAMATTNSEKQSGVFFANVGSWSTKERLPQCIIENGSNEKDTWALMFQIESNHSWYYEINDKAHSYYFLLGGGNLTHTGWSKRLLPAQTYTTVTVAVSFGKDVNEAVREMTKYRRHIKCVCQADVHVPTIFNSYMHLFWDSPQEDKVREVAAKVARTGIEYFVIDCGWHDEEPGSEIYPYVGRWIQSKTRFPSGIRKTTDYIRSLGMKAGLWIEPEIVGKKCKHMLDYYGDDCFIQRFGKKVCTHGRYFLDFRNKKVYDYLWETVCRMVEDYGADYVKLDYNQDLGIGTDKDCDSLGNGLEMCQQKFLEWVDNVKAKYPQVLFENCASGGMRMDWKTLQHFPLTSTSDQTNYKKYPYIVGNVLSAVLPEQAAVWSYPVDSLQLPNAECSFDKQWAEENVTEEQVVFNMINSFLGRIHLASHIDFLSEKKFALIKEGIDYYNRISGVKKKALPYFPLGFTRIGEQTVAAGIRADDKIYLAVWNLHGDPTVSIDIGAKIKEARVGYPATLSTNYTMSGNTLQIHFAQDCQARFFEIETE